LLVLVQFCTILTLTFFPSIPPPRALPQQKMFTTLDSTYMHGAPSKQVLKANQTEIFANGDSGLAGTDVALGGPRPVQAGFF